MKELKRLSGWEKRLRLFIEARRFRPFEWGANDCVTFGLDHIRDVLTGADLYGAFPSPLWTSERDAARYMADVKLDEHWDNALGGTNYGWRMARRGDIGLIVSGPNIVRPTSAVVLGAHCAAPGPNGLSFAPTSNLGKVWRIG